MQGPHFLYGTVGTGGISAITRWCLDKSQTIIFIIYLWNINTVDIELILPQPLLRVLTIQSA